MNDVERLERLLDSGELLHPVSGGISIVDLANALHDVMGVDGVSLGDAAARVKRLIGDQEHLVLVMADGYGMNFVETLERDGFIRTHLAGEMRTVFPSTTPIVLTSLATGEWPAVHSVIGWFQKLRQIDAVSTIISHIRTSDKKPLAELGLTSEDAYPVPSRVGRSSREAVHIMPENLIDSIYTNYWTGGIGQIGYEMASPDQAIQKAIAIVRKAIAPTSVYLYLPHVDSAAHRLGTGHQETLAAALQLDLLLGELAGALPTDARLVMTADHGHLDAPKEKTFVLEDSDEIIRLCGGELTGDPRAIYAHVSEGNVEALRLLIQQRFGRNFLVLSAGEVEKLGLLGKGTLAAETRYRMGGALVLSTGDAVLDYRAALGDDVHPMVSHHGGLTPAEMRIPLVVA